MQEVEDNSEGEFELEVPEPPPLVRQPEKTQKKSLKDRVQCAQCGKWISEYCHRYSHKCKARPPDEPPVKAVEKPEKN